MAVSSDSTAGLRTELAAVLPKGCRFRFHHLSTPPLKTDALCSAPPDERPDRTYCEKHFLAVSVDANASDPQKRVLVLGLEIFVYTTAYATTLFVSKADSTGFLGLVSLHKGPSEGTLSKGTPSPIRQVCAAFIRHLVETRRRKGLQLVVSLFARAQDQYLFPGSAKHTGKHVLDDRGLVKWWCRVLDPLLTSPPVGRAALPSKNIKAAASWLLGHPLERISHYHGEFDWVPPRCLIPRFPDDPKSRFRDELDDEAARSGSMQTLGTWKSVKTLDTFWEVMGFRQECSSGRMTGFIWVVFDDEDDRGGARHAAESTHEAPVTPKKTTTTVDVTPNTTPRKLFPAKAEPTNAKPPSCNKEKGKKKKKKQFKGRITSRRPRIKTEQRNYLADRPTSSKYYYWPPQGRGERLVDESDYKRTVELLLHLDFSTLDKATGSSRRWIGEAGLWGLEVTGTREPSGFQNGEAGDMSAQINNLSGLVKRKRTDTAESEARPGRDGEVDTGVQTLGPQSQDVVKTLGSGLVRKKPKT
ncbi:H3 K56 histone acetylation protein KAT11 [Ophiocordyceps sinensis CO18]|uniref:histone acetyltransferase n=1 Tax=Ophiocordyceps sinensis (strain Co18 / CGMCC 3.14243) TaxID=911162 RepID=T5ADL4_OPHSC|nr:H3 K56 histone acetylation protein KAT11 [Ophiocordyceps sinensis CO18]